MKRYLIKEKNKIILQTNSLEKAHKIQEKNPNYVIQTYHSTPKRKEKWNA